jgi:hypothetical protein
MTTAEQVAVLDAELERSTGDFDGMILEEQARQRAEARRSGGSVMASDYESGTSGNSGEPGGGSGGYSSAGGMPEGEPLPGGVASADIPQNTARYPAPADIPSGNNDDVVARQLREAAMREPDPKVREKLWDEYRKYKGIDK